MGLGVGEVAFGFWDVISGSANYVYHIGATCVGSTAGWVDGVVTGIPSETEGETTEGSERKQTVNSNSRK